MNQLFQQLPAPLLRWYRENRRILPWREQPEPYRVWISEIMLQQTRVEAVIPYYEHFLAALPDIPSLAAASEEQLLKLWEGLGYYSRVRNLQKAAQILVQDYDARLPADPEALLSLPGIGDYTAGAISSIAFGLPVPAVDGNVLRICTRMAADSSNIASATTKKKYRSLLKELYCHENAADLTQALMELGATVCIPNGFPLCDRCPAMSFCLAHKQQQETLYPVKPMKKQRKIQQRRVWLIHCQGKWLLHRRPKQGLLAGLWELPNTGEDENLPFAVPDGEACGEAVHIFSHLEWRMQGFVVNLSKAPSLAEDWRWASAEEIQEKIALPSAFDAFSHIYRSRKM